MRASNVGKIRVFLNNGNGTFSLTPVLSNCGPTPTAITTVPDQNADAIDDLAVANFYYGKVRVLYSALGGNYTIAQVITVGSYPNAVLVTNLGAGPGKLALVVVNKGSNNIMIFEQ